LNENLGKAVKKQKGKIVNYLSPSLCIRHKPTRIEYTIKKIKIIDGAPFIVAYRYSLKSPKENKKIFIEIPKTSFKEYEQV